MNPEREYTTGERPESTVKRTKPPGYYRAHKEACDRAHNKWLNKPGNRERWNAYQRARRARNG